MDGEHAISCPSQPFAKVWNDMALEQCTDGAVQKTAKSVLFQILEKDISVEPRLTLPSVPTVYIIDAMA